MDGSLSSPRSIFISILYVPYSVKIIKIQWKNSKESRHRYYRRESQERNSLARYTVGNAMGSGTNTRGQHSSLDRLANNKVHLCVSVFLVVATVTLFVCCNRRQCLAMFWKKIVPKNGAQKEIHRGIYSVRGSEKLISSCHFVTRKNSLLNHRIQSVLKRPLFKEVTTKSRMLHLELILPLPFISPPYIFTTSLYFLNDRNVSKLGRDRWLNVGFHQFAGTYRPEARKIVI